MGAALLHACGGGGGFNSVPNPDATVTVSGKITFERPHFADDARGLDMTNPDELPARSVVVQAIDASSNSVLAETNTDASGAYSFAVPGDRLIFVRAKAQIVSTGSSPTYNFRVLNNTNNNALYTLDSSSFNTGTANVSRNLKAASGWNGTAYSSDAERTAAPFAILDTINDAKDLILSADATRDLRALDLYWSAQNKATVNELCIDTGDIGTSFYQSTADIDDCNQQLPPGIYVLGDYADGAGDTDEFDDHVIAHEFGHYVEDQVARSDSFGGDHGPSDSLDLRVAFSEGWGDAFAGMVLNDPIYRDSQNGVSNDFTIDVEDDAAPDGWYSESSVGEILWDLFDPANEPGDTLALGFAPMYKAMTTAQKSTDALTSIFPFIVGVREQEPAQSAAIETLLANEGISGTDEFGTGESNAGADASALPIYRDVAVGDQLNVCSTQNAGSASANKLGNHKFFRFKPTGTTLVTILVTGAVAPSGGASVAATDPDIYVFKRGVIEAVADEAGTSDSIAQHSFAAGTYVIDVFDYDVQSANTTTRRCMTLSLQGN